MVLAYHNVPAAITVPRGLLPAVRALAPVKVHDRRLAFARADFGWRGDLYPYQAAAAREVFRRDGGVLVMAPGGGKTVCGLAVAAAWGQPTLWVTHTKELAHQALDAARRFYHLPPEAFGLVMDGLGPGEHQRPLITVAMVQTLAANEELTRGLAARVGTVLLDEAHHQPAVSFSRVVGRFPARFRGGLSATPDRTDGLGPLMQAMLGSLVVVPLRTLVLAGRILLPRIELVHTGLEAFEGEGDDWNALEALRAQDRERNRLILRLAAGACRAGRRCLILVNRKDHSQILAQALDKAGVRAFAATGEVVDTQRARWFSLLERGEAVVIATRLADEGLDLPRLDTLILAAAARSRVRLEQQIGRVMRTASGKRDAVCFDLADVRIGAYARQVRERLDYYADVGYAVRQWSARGNAIA